MTVTHPEANGGMFQDATFTYGELPQWVKDLTAADYGWLSDDTYEGSLGTYQYYLFCINGIVGLTRAFSDWWLGGTYLEITRYTWDPADSCERGSPAVFYQNTCCPTYLMCGDIFAGGDAVTVVTIEEC
jgi:hypothetical protein